MAARHQRKPVRVEADASGERPPEIEQLVYEVPKADKPAALRALLDERGDGPVIVFGKTKHGVKKLAKQLIADGYPVGALQGNLSQNARERVMASFRTGETPILVATNVAARGLDVEGVERVINYDLPDSPELFTHRVGRTGRMGRQGEAITFICEDDGPKWREIERTLKLRLPRRRWAERASAGSG
jgi:ATP-dependent RNA helicase DeaD